MHFATFVNFQEPIYLSHLYLFEWFCQQAWQNFFRYETVTNFAVLGTFLNFQFPRAFLDKSSHFIWIILRTGFMKFCKICHSCLISHLFHINLVGLSSQVISIHLHNYFVNRCGLILSDLQYWQNFHRFTNVVNITNKILSICHFCYSMHFWKCTHLFSYIYHFKLLIFFKCIH